MVTTSPAAVLRALALTVSTAVLLGCASAGAASLVPPAGFRAPVAEAKGDSAKPCETPPPPFTGALEFPSKYEGSDSARDDLNPEAYRRYLELTAPIKDLERGLSSLVDKYVRSGRPELLDCAIDWLERWAGAGALRGEAKNHTGKSMRKWALASVSSAYLRLKFSDSRPLGEHADKAAAIERWIGEVADRVVEEWSGQPLEKFNNHEYWAAWAVAASAVVTGRRDLFDWSVRQFRTAAQQVDRDGYLPNELKRDTRALAYHNYSLGPLVMIAAFARANGVDLTGENDAALRRLADRVLAGVEDPKTFERKTGKRQELEDLAEDSKFSWLEPYCTLYPCEGAAARRLAAVRPLKTYRLGGNLTRLFAPQADADRPSRRDREREDDKDDQEG